MNCSLEGRSAIITGGNRGLGLAIARAYVAKGANVLLCARDGAELEKVRAELSELASANQVVAVQIADVSQTSDSEQLVARALQLFPRVHVLVNNAGIYGPKGLIEELDWEAWVEAIRINLFGSVFLCRAILPHFKSHNYGKIVQISGGGATSPMPRVSAYAASKAAIVRFIESLAGEVRENGIDVNALAPGAMNTRMLDEILAAGPDKVGDVMYARLVAQKEEGGVPPERAAELAVFLASSSSDGITGKLISAVWDPWETLPAHLNDLQQTDVYALRRILPTDRGLNWG